MRVYLNLRGMKENTASKENISSQCRSKPAELLSRARNPAQELRLMMNSQCQLVEPSRLQTFATEPLIAESSQISIS